ncbi:MAG: hypothetical protein BGP25_04985 [Lysobacterales bacterium 63-13]|nr:MAG: hypothetical protein BGP25_04985 [Xanthomonadales bacterium 63-13]
MVSARHDVAPEDLHSVTWATIHSIACPSEPFLSFLQRWDHFLGARDLGNRHGSEIINWFVDQLLSHPISKWQLPSSYLTIRTIRNPFDAEKALAALGARVDQVDRETNAHARRADDVERLGGSPARVAFARTLVAHNRERTRADQNQLQAWIQEQLETALAASVAARITDAGRWRLPVPGDLSRKPTPASIEGWFTATYDGRSVYTNDHIVDLVGEPHLNGWQERRALGNTNPAVDALIKASPRTRGVVIGIYDQVLERKKTRRLAPVVAIAFGERVLCFGIRHVRYFLSKYKGAEFIAQADDPVALVMQAGQIVGIICSCREYNDENGRVSTTTDVAERFAMAAAEPAKCDAPARTARGRARHEAHA